MARRKRRVRRDWAAVVQAQAASGLSIAAFCRQQRIDASLFYRWRPVHRVASLAKRWLLGTHQGSVDSAHLMSYLDEFVFRFNRGRSRSRGMVFYRVLELAVRHAPVRYQDLIASHRPRKAPPTPPKRRGHPASLERDAASRPWRLAEPQTPTSASSG